MIVCRDYEQSSLDILLTLKTPHIVTKITALAIANHDSLLIQIANSSVFFTKFLHFFVYYRHMIDDRL